jgi:hypothetical protein
VLIWKVILDRDDPAVRFDMRMIYSGAFEIIKMVTTPAGAPDLRVDGIPAHELERPMDGAEYPVQDHLRVMQESAGLALVSRDIFSADIQPDRTIRLTLLRSPNFVHNGNFKDPVPDYHLYPLTAQGDHCYRIALMAVGDDAPDIVASEVYRLSDPVWMSETTHGMPPRNHEGKQFAEDKKSWEKKP